MNNKNPTRHVFKYKHMKWSHWCITASVNYKNTMINRITMKTVACLRSKCHLKQNLIPSWPWSFRHTSCISDFRCKTKNFVGHPDRHTWQYCRSLWFSARLFRRISKSLITKIGYGYVCMREIDLNLNKLHYLGTVNRSFKPCDFWQIIHSGLIVHQ